jgi:peptidoglycan hydrolase-like protein with peptidoglycan-binding domain
MRRLLCIALLAPLGALASGPFTSLHPEDFHSDPMAQGAPSEYSGLITEVQKKLRALGFDAGPPNGDFGEKTQAALAQFQLSRTIPASGQLDEETLYQLDVKRPALDAAAGNTAAPNQGVAETPPKQ